jgi:SAM-dependent methyltransferase
MSAARALPATRRRAAAGGTDTAVEPLHARRAYDTFAPFYDEFTAHHDYDDWTATLERLARASGLEGNRLLDVACGTGKSFLPFLARGYAVTACDISPAMVALARRKAAGRARVLVADMRALPDLGTFDLVTVLDDAVNYLLDEHELVAALYGASCQLAQDGVLVFDTNTLLAYRTFFATTGVVQSDGRVQIWEGRSSARLAAGGTAEAVHTALERQADGTWRRSTSLHRQRHHTQAAVQRALRQAGLRLVARGGMHLDGTVDDGVDELVNSKAVYIARH